MTQNWFMELPKSGSEFDSVFQLVGMAFFGGRRVKIGARISKTENKKESYFGLRFVRVFLGILLL